VKVDLVCVAALGLAACAAGPVPDEAESSRVVVEGHTVYVVGAGTEQAARLPAVSACRARGGSATFVGIVQFRAQRRPSTTKAAQFECTA
jgi:hypothetical protein